MREYLVIKWDEKSQTAPMLRTTDKDEWKKMISKVKELYGLTNSTARIAVREKITIFSFVATISAYPAWADIPYFQRPLEIKKPFQR